MFVLKTLIITLSFSCYAHQSSALPALEESSAFSWPDGALAAVSLAYDDALNSHLDNALPLLNHFGFKASFYLTLNSPTVKFRRSEWRKLALQGHELGNHTINHACRASLPNRQWVEEQNDLDKKSIQAIKDEIVLANEILKSIDDKNSRTFTVPCGDTTVEGKDLLPEITDYFVGIKSHVGSVPKSMEEFNPMNASVFVPVGLNGNTLIKQVKMAAQHNTIASFTFHGIGADHLQTPLAAHQELLAYLDRNRDLYWVDTFENISRYVKRSRLKSTIK